MEEVIKTTLTGFLEENEAIEAFIKDVLAQSFAEWDEVIKEVYH